MDAIKRWYGEERETLISEGFRGTYVSAQEIETSPNPCAVMPHEIVPFGKGACIILIDLVFDGDCHIPFAPHEAIGTLGIMIQLSGSMEVIDERQTPHITQKVGPGDCLISRISDPVGRAVYHGGTHFRAVCLSLTPEDADDLLALDWSRQKDAVRKVLSHERSGLLVTTGERLRNLARGALDCNLEGGLRTDFLTAIVPGLMASISEAVTSQSLWPRTFSRTSLVDAAMDARDRLSEMLDDPPTLEELAGSLGQKPRSLAAALQDVFDMSIAELVRELRLSRAREELSRDDMTLETIAQRAGYGHVSNFTTAFRRRFNLSPRAFQKVNVETVR